MQQAEPIHSTLPDAPFVFEQGRALADLWRKHDAYDRAALTAKGREKARREAAMSDTMDAIEKAREKLFASPVNTLADAAVLAVENWKTADVAMECDGGEVWLREQIALLRVACARVAVRVADIAAVPLETLLFPETADLMRGDAGVGA